MGMFNKEWVKIMLRVAIVSGKGGTGKTTITASLAVMMAEKRKIIAVDCDVDTPNLALLLADPSSFEWEAVHTSEKATMDYRKCIGCKRCVEACAFNAMNWNEKSMRPEVKTLYCEGCGACNIVCPVGAITIRKVKNGRIGYGLSRYGFWMVTGELEVGESGSGKVVMDVKKKAIGIARKEDIEVMLVDASAGIGCPVIASITGMNHVIIVVEPTPSSLSDMKRMIKVVEHFSIPYDIVINKYDINDRVCSQVERFARRKDVDIIAKLPHDIDFVRSLQNLVPLVEYTKKYNPIFEDMVKYLLKQV